MRVVSAAGAPGGTDAAGCAIAATGSAASETPAKAATRTIRISCISRVTRISECGRELQEGSTNRPATGRAAANGHGPGDCRDIMTQASQARKMRWLGDDGA